MTVSTKTKLCVVIGDPAEHSLSPLLHNTGYKAVGKKNEFTYLACKVASDKIEDFIKGVRAMRISGVSCTIPHKIAVMPYLDEVDNVAKK